MDTKHSRLNPTIPSAPYPCKAPGGRPTNAQKHGSSERNRCLFQALQEEYAAHEAALATADEEEVAPRVLSEGLFLQQASRF